jgi:hypothetical protein
VADHRGPRLTSAAIRRGTDELAGKGRQAFAAAKEGP